MKIEIEVNDKVVDVISKAYKVDEFSRIEDGIDATLLAINFLECICTSYEWGNSTGSKIVNKCTIESCCEHLMKSAYPDIINQEV